MERISGLTLKEWIELRSSIHAIENEKFNCQKCLAKYQGRPDGKEMTAKVQRINACKEIGTETVHRLGDDLRYSTCIGNFYKPQVIPLLEAHRRYELGQMPYVGGLMDQPAKVIQAFEVIASCKAEIKAKEEKRMARAQQRGGARGN